MEAHLLEWVNLGVRWLHVIAGIAWIGSSFYFIWLDASLRDPEKPNDQLAGDLWAIHGGGFYHVEKYKIAPEKLPKILHWFKWEAYTTWMSGFALLILVYYVNADAYLLDSSVRSMPAWQGILIGLASLAVGWIVYDVLCRISGKSNLITALVGFPLVVAMMYGFTQVFGSRAAYLHVGAVLGTIMAANVFFVIIPSQKELVRAAAAGQSPNPEFGTKAKQRSLHNNYITLPVVFVMISNHYPSTYGHAWNWAILAGIFVAGGAIRHFFNLRNKGHLNVWILPVSIVALFALAVVTAPKKTADGPKVSFPQAKDVIDRRCVSCHSAKPTDPAFPVPPSGIVFDTPEKIKALAVRIKERAVVSKTMPLANRTGITEEERALLGRWIEAGAALE